MKKTQQQKNRTTSSGKIPSPAFSVLNGHYSQTQPGTDSGKHQNGKKKKTRTNIWRILWIAGMTIIASLVVVLLAGYLLWQQMLSQVHVINPSDETIPSEFNVPTESLAIPVPVEKHITNILLLGVDSRDDASFAERSDSMMILTIDEINDKIKLTSLQRDMLVYIPGRKEPGKLNTANALGGPLLAIRVVNETFRLSIDQYVVINMSGMEKLIDLAGGIMVDVESDEITPINGIIADANYSHPQTPQAAMITKPGLQLVNGRQAVAYARIRKLDNDYKRMERQRTILQSLFKKFLSADLISKKNLVYKGLSLITTNISAGRITDIGLKIVPMMNADFEQLQIPIKGYFQEYSGDSWVNLCDFNGMIPLMQKFIFGKTYPFDPVKVIPGAPNSGIRLPTPTPTKKPTAPPPTLAPTPTPLPTTTTLAPTAETSLPTTAASQATSGTASSASSTSATETTKDHGKPTSAASTTPAATVSTTAPTTIPATTATKD